MGAPSWWPGWPGCWPARSRWRWASGSRSPAHASCTSARSRSSAASCSTSPGEEQAELALIYQAKGLPQDQARDLAARLIADRPNALDTLAREELGIDPEELGGSAWEAALPSFLLFALGAIVPVAPFLFLSGLPAVIASVALSGLGLFG